MRVIVTSATIDTDRFAEHFADADGLPAPVFLVEGRTFPVEVRYRPFGADNVDDPADDRDQVRAILDAVDELANVGDGDVLVFLSGEREIHDVADALREQHESRGWRHALEVLPLYARLSSAEQHRIFEPHAGRRVVLSTNVAETSITVPGVRYVIDTGVARISRYSRRLKVQRLPIEPVSQASANQRSGRCGRVAPGVCIRLYAEEDFGERPEFTEPEILRTNLASVILQMTAIGLGDVAQFPFVEAPDAAIIKDGYLLLEELGALAEGRIGAPRSLTEIGRQLAKLPVDPRLGRMVLEADRQGCVREVLVIASALSIQDIRERPKESAERATELHRRFDVEGSDLLSIVALWDYLRDRQRGAVGQSVPPDVSRGVPQLPSSARSGATSTASFARLPASSAFDQESTRHIPITCTKRCLPVCSHTSANAAKRVATFWVPEKPDSPSPVVRCWPESRRSGSWPRNWWKPSAFGPAGSR